MSDILTKVNNISEARSAGRVRDEDLEAILDVSFVIEVDRMECKVLCNTCSPRFDQFRSVANEFREEARAFRFLQKLAIKVDQLIRHERFKRRDERAPRSFDIFKRKNRSKSDNSVKPLARFSIASFLICENKQRSLAVRDVPDLLLLRYFANAPNDRRNFVFGDFVKRPFPKFGVFVRRQLSVTATVRIAASVGKKNVVAFFEETIR